MKRRHLLISLSTSAGALIYGFHQKKAAAAELAQTLIDNICTPSYGLFVLYYGFISDPGEKDQSLREIMSKKPSFVIFGDGEKEQRQRKDIPAYVHQNSGRAIMYIALGYGKNQTNEKNNEIDSKIDEAMNAGYDGIFFDETGIQMHSWNKDRATRMRSYDTTKTKTAIFNPGEIPPDESVFEYADIVCVENNYNPDQKLQSSHPNTFPQSWLAVQGDPGCKDENGDGQLDEKEKAKCERNKAPASYEEAIERAETFREQGGFWYYSSSQAPQDWTRPTHIELPSWYGNFADWIKSQPQICPPFSPIRLK